MTIVAARPHDAGFVPAPLAPEGGRDVERAVLGAVRDALPPGPCVLAVSGGLDSSVLLDAAARTRSAGDIVVATFDHGTGAAARGAAALVAARCAALGVRVIVGRSDRAATSEAAWREARWRFLREVAASFGGPVATAHTRDDQIETVAMRVFRDAGARGLAGLAAPSPGIVRPFLALARRDLARYAEARALPISSDPSNASRAHLRNRVRHDLLPALRRVRPRIDDELWEIGIRAAAWRAPVDALATRIATPADGGVRVARHSLAGYDAESLSVVWPAVAALAGVTLDRRGTRRLATFTRIACTGARVPLSGGATAVRERDGWWIGRPRAPKIESREGEHVLADGTSLGAWRFSCIESGGASPDAWSALLPADLPLTVRKWRDGDRLAGGAVAPPRRVARWFADAGVPSAERRGWPVVLAGGEIVWIPGVRRSDAASVRSGRPGLRYLCERNLR